MAPSSRNPKRALYEAFADVAKAVAQSHRLEMLELLAQGERSVEDLADRCSLSMASTSQHLQVLLGAGLVTVRRDGRRRLYRLVSDAAVELICTLRAVAEAHHAISQQVIRDYFVARDKLDPITRDELVARIAEGTATLLDVRPADEFVQGHLPGALNIPSRDIEARIAELDPATEIIAYCRGPYCVLSFDAVDRLCARGFRARRFTEGLPEWRAAGLPVETTPRRGDDRNPDEGDFPSR